MSRKLSKMVGRKLERVTATEIPGRGCDNEQARACRGMCRVLLLTLAVKDEV